MKRLVLCSVLLVAACAAPVREPDPVPDGGSGTATCGDARLDPGEGCEPELSEGPGACPTACDDQDPCTEDTLSGSAEECSARCEHRPVSACVAGDACCPAGCAGSDGDCASCEDECSIDGALRCAGNAVISCGNHDGDACLEWSAHVPCAGATTCSAGACAATCTSDCTVVGARKCDETGAIVTCGDPNDDGCLKWSAPVRCSSPQVCSAGDCALDCRNECPTPDARQCVAGTTGLFERCADHDLDGCLEWGAAQGCADGLVCSAGACEATCTSTCTTDGAKSCRGSGWATCGDYNTDGCLEWGTEVACSAVERCLDGACVSRPAPATVVVSEILYDTTGSPDRDSFVELHGPAGLSLVGFRLTGINGNAGTPYNEINLVGSLGADGLYVVAHPNAAASTLAQADQLDAKVDYQNGPDSIQLRWGATIVDAVGYGAFTAADVFGGEGSAVPGPAMNASLGRDAQETDTDVNAADFHGDATPTPGAANAPTGAVCGNGRVETGEACDGNCPTACGDGDACTTDALSGSAGACSALCTSSAISRCANGDGCCPSGCNSTTDGDCAPVCGNGAVEWNETCDGNCPASCSDGDACTTDVPSGSAAACDAVCSRTAITRCASGDGCCPSGCNSTSDGDCAPAPCPGTSLGSATGARVATGTTTGAGADLSASCGGNYADDVSFGWTAPATGTYTFDTNGSAFDTVLYVLASCGGATLGCNDDSGGVRSSVTLSLSAGQGVVIVVDGFGTSAVQASGAFVLNVTPAACGNGVVDPGELCDGACPTSCGDGLACTADTLTGSAATCDAACSHAAITLCAGGDGCCPSGCNTTTDGDCSASCGNGVVEGNERCDGTCPTSCSDGNACTTDVLTGSAATCSAVCGHSAVTQCAGGDGCCPAGCNASTDGDCASSACPGTSLGSATGARVATGSTVGAGADLSASCGGSLSPDVAFSWTAPSAGTWTFDTSGSSFDTVLYVLASCGGATLGCNDDASGTASGSSRLSLSLSAGQNVVVVVDGFGVSGAGKSGDYVLNVNGAVCGNGVVDPGELCDGNCPTSCSDQNACTTDALTGSAASCTAACTHQAVTQCTGGDGCCPSGCGASADGDCSAPSRYTVTTNTVSDGQTGLLWQRNVPTSTYTQRDAWRYCRDLTLAGYTDWRLPWVTELQGLLVPGSAPQIDRTVFPSTPSQPFWSDQTQPGYTTYYLTVSFADGRVQGLEEGSFWRVRCVR